MTALYCVIIIALLIVTVIFLKRLYHKKKKIILEIGPSLKDKGGMVTVMEQIENSRLKEKYNIKHISTYKNKIKVLFIFPAIFKILLYKIIYRIELGHIHMASYGSCTRKSIIIRLLKLLNIKIIIHIHGARFNKFYETSSIRKKKKIKKILNEAEQVIVLSESWKDFFTEIVEKEKIVVLHNAVNLPKLELKEKDKQDCKNILFLGRLGERKGIYDILNAAKQIKEEFQNMHLKDNEQKSSKDFSQNIKMILAGDGEIEKVKDIVKQENLEEIIEVKGWVDSKEKEILLKKADIYILPSYDEGMPMSILEAMSYSLPVVTTEVGGIPEIVKDNENGILIKPGDIEGLKESILKLVNDEKIRKDLGSRARDTIKEKFNIENQIYKLEELYLNIKYKNLKVCLTSSAGGHFTQLKQLFKMAEKYNTFIMTEKNVSSKSIENLYKVIFLTQQERKNFDFIFKFVLNIIKTIFVSLFKNPDVVISTGAGATTIVCLMTKILGGKVIFIESFAKVSSPTLTGKIVYKFADEFYVQWEEMKKFYPKAQYKGGIY